MRKLAALIVGALAIGALAATPAAAQNEQPETIFTSSAKIFPQKAGTKRKPQGHRLAGSFGFRTVTEGVEPPIVTGGDIFIPKHGHYNGGKYAKCSKRQISSTRGPQACPKKSIMGSGKGVAFADNVDAKPDVVLVNGGKNLVWAYTTLYNPALVQEPIAVRIRTIKHKKWRYKVSFRVPEVLQVVAGVPITLRSFRYSIGGKKYARNYITTTGCPKSKKYPYQATAFYLYNDNTRSSHTYKGTVACR